MNSNLSDIATALTQSIATTGVSTVSGSVPFAAGTVGAPGITFAGSLTTGFYVPSAGQVAVAASGVQSCLFTSSGVTIPTGFAFNTSTVSFGSAANANAFITALAENFTILFTIDGGGSTPTTGSKGFVEVPCNATITRSTILADQSGSAVVDINKSTYAGFPPTVSICAAALPTLSTQQNAQDSTLTGWTTSLTAGDILLFKLNSVTTCQRVQVSLLCKRTSR